MRLLLALLFGTTLLLAAPIPKEKPKVKDEEAILGKWQFDKIDIGKNDPRAAESLNEVTIEFKKDNKFTVTPPAKAMEKALDGEVKLKETEKVKEFDAEVQGMTIFGVYELDGDSLKFCIGFNTKVRPKEIKADDPSRIVVVTFKRVVEEKKDK